MIQITHNFVMLALGSRCSQEDHSPVNMDANQVDKNRKEDMKKNNNKTEVTFTCY